MGSSFEALRPLADGLKEKARERAEERDKAEKTERRVARDTGDFLRFMSRTGVKRVDGTRIPQVSAPKDISFAAAMRRAGVEPLGSGERVQHAGRKVPPEPRQAIADRARVLEESLSDDNDSIEFLESEDGLAFRRPGVGPDVPRDLRRGRWSVVGQIDLHGMFVAEAREAVVKFLRNSQLNERLCVRIIHGKGNGSPDRQSVLREKVRRWLKQREEVVAFCEPREIDGGAGATIVRLRPRSRPGEKQA